MIEQLLAHRETIPYAMALCAIILAVFAGYLLGHKDPAILCSTYIVEAERQTAKAFECNRDLTTCKATKAGGAVIDCGPLCAERVSKALKNHKDIICED